MVIALTADDVALLHPFSPFVGFKRLCLHAERGPQGLDTVAGKAMGLVVLLPAYD